MLEPNSKKDQGQYEKFAIENKGMFRIGSVDCSEFKQICDKEGVQQYPTYKVFPPHPVPTVTIEHDVAQTIDTDKLKKEAYRYIGNRVIEISAQNIDSFIGDNPGKPKMLLFTDKKSTPMVYRALSTYFDVSTLFDSALLENSGIWNS